MISKVYQITEEEFRKIIAENNSWCSCAKAIGLSPNGSNSKIQIQKRAKELNCDTSHFINTRNGNSYAKYTLEEIMIENSPYQNTTRLKERIIQANIIPYECSICGNKGEWNGAKLVLQLDHINGKHHDHRKENLRFLCPNCHSQTETYSGKNK